MSKSLLKSRAVLLIGILLLAFLLRFYKLGEIPPGVNRDEASIGYTAYSLLKTGQDEYGETLPLSFKSFGDWKLPIYIYLTIPFVKVFGISEISVRAVSAIAGTMTVVLTYFLVREIINSKGLKRVDAGLNIGKVRKENVDVEKIALLTTGLLAASPWHIHLSRVESESNLAVFLITLAVLLFLKSLKRWNGLIILSSLLFSLTYFTYHGNHVFTTLLLFGLLVIFKKEMPRNRITFASALIFLFLTGFILSKTLFSADITKLSGISIFGDPALVHKQIELPRNEHGNPQSFFSRVLHNKVIFALERFGQNYIKAFSAEFLFIKGGTNSAHNIKDFGNMYLVEAPFLLLGILYLVVLHRRRRFSRETTLFIFWWFLIAPIASSITKDAPHTNRMFAVFPILPLITAFGIFCLLNIISEHKFFKKIVTLGISIIFLLNISIYLDRYFIHFPIREGENWGIAYKKLSKFLENQDGNYNEIIISRPRESPYIFLLFYQQYDPTLFRRAIQWYPPTADGFIHAKKLGKYTFRDIRYPEDLRAPNRLLIDKTTDMEIWAKNDSYLAGQDAHGRVYVDSHLLDKIALPDGSPYYSIISTSPRYEPLNTIKTRITK